MFQIRRCLRIQLHLQYQGLCSNRSRIHPSRINAKHSNLRNQLTNLTGSRSTVTPSLCQHKSRAEYVLSQFRTLIMEPELVSEMLLYLNHLDMAVSLKNFVGLCCLVSLKIRLMIRTPLSSAQDFRFIFGRPHIQVGLMTSYPD